MKVVDASVVVKLLLNEDGSGEAKKLLKGKEEIIVPDILFVEVANVLATKTNFTIENIEEALELIYQIGLKVEITNKAILIRAGKLAKEKGTAVYDMIYAVIAEKKKILLVTADEKFLKKVKFKFVKLLKKVV